MRAECITGNPSQPAPATSDIRHILFIIDRLPRTLGGGEGVLLNMIKLLPKDRFRCSVLTFDLEPGSAFEGLSCPLHVFRMRRTYDLNAARMAARLAKLIRSERIQIVHTFFESSDIWGGFVARVFTGARLVSSRRDMGILRSTKHKLAYRMLSSFPDKVLCVSDQVRQFCIAADRIAPEKVVTVYSGVELPPRRNAVERMQQRNHFGYSQDLQIVVTVANIRRVKGLDVLLYAAEKVCNENQRAVFLIVGGVLEQDYFLELQQLAQRLNIAGRIKFAGEHKAVRPLLEMSDAFVLPSRSEGFSNALLEAMACELPCIATNVGGNVEAIEDGLNGLIVEAGNAGSLAHAISRILNDLDRAKQMARAARRTVEIRFTPERMIAGLVTVYESLLDRNRSEQIGN
jgi:glycosyltransferase involved in cell wall biosynthesis